MNAKYALGALLVGAAALAHAGSLLRVTCEEANAGAIVSVNGKKKGPCPIDVEVPAGVIKLTAAKTYADGQSKLFEQAVEVGDGAIVKVSVQLLSQKAIELIRSAEGGSITSMLLLASSYRQGGGGLVPKDPEKYFYWSLKAAERGESSSMFAVGQAYVAGEVIPKDDATAAAWFKRGHERASAEAAVGDVDAMVTLGSAYFKGLGVPANRAQAAAWFRRVKDKGEPVGQMYLDLYGLN